MNKHKISKRQLLRCLQTVQDHCEASDVWSGDTFAEYCSNPHNIELLKTLKAMNAVQMVTIENGNVNLPVYAFPLDNAGSVWLENSEKWKDRILGYVFGFVSAALIEILRLVLTGSI